MKIRKSYMMKHWYTVIAIQFIIITVDIKISKKKRAMYNNSNIIVN